MNHFEQPVDHRMTEEEAQAVLHVLAERQREREGVRPMPSVQDVASIAKVPVNDVQDALAHVRARFVPAQESAAKRRNIALPIIAATLAVVILTVLMAGMLLRPSGGIGTTVMPSEMPPPAAKVRDMEVSHAAASTSFEGTAVNAPAAPGSPTASASGG